MFNSLPINYLALKEQALNCATRKVLASLILALAACRSLSLVIKISEISVVICSIILAANLGSGYPLVGLSGLFLLPLAGKFLKKRHFQQTQKAVADARLHPDFDESIFLQSEAVLNWDILSAEEKRMLLGIGGPSKSRSAS